MKILKRSVTLFLVGLLAVGLASTLQAQDKRAAVETYNRALEMANNGEYEQAINQFNQAIAQAEELGEEGQNIVERIEQRLPQLQYQLALQKYKAFQNDRTIESIDAAIEGFRQTVDVGEEYGDTQIAEKAGGVITQLLYNKSLLQYNQGDNEAALETLDETIERNENYAKAYYQKGIVVKNMDEMNLDRALDLFDQAIEIGNQTNDTDIVSNAQEAAREQLVYVGSQEIEAENFDRAVELLSRALEYESTSANAHYRLAEAYNQMQEWEQAVEHAKQGLQYEDRGRTEQAKIYFELANAYQGLGQQQEACDAYSNAAYGSFKSPSEHQMEYELECESMTG